MADLDVGVTTLHRPTKTTVPTAASDPARVLAWATDYSGLLVSVPRNERRTGEVTFSFDDPICQHLFRDVTENVTGHTVQISTLLEVMLFVRWRGTPILWAPIVTMDWRQADRKVTVSAVDVQRLIDHQIHHGDTAFPEAPADRHVDGTSTGIATVLSAADMSTAQLNDGVPDHGIHHPAGGTGGAGASALSIAIALDDNVWDKLVEITTYQDAVDISNIPRDVEDPTAFPYYSDLTCYTAQGGTPENVIFEAGFGRDNAESLDWSPGGPYMTHAIVRDANNRHRVPKANIDARRRTGAYVHQENLPSASPAGTMTARAKALIKEYSLPVDAHTVVLRVPDPRLEALGVVYHAFDDFDLGDVVTCETHDGFYHKKVQGQINEIRVRQDDANLAVTREEIDVVPELVDVTDIGDEDP
jgi:hypothetical protein